MTQQNRDEVVGKAIGKVVGCGMAGVVVALVIIAHIAIEGWSLMLIWNWFMPPLFGLPALTLLPAAGLTMLATALQNPVERDWKDQPDLWWKLAKRVLLFPAGNVFIAWVIHWLWVR